MSVHTDIQTLYLTVYNRPADWEGLVYWTGQIEAEGLEAVNRAFTEAPEFDALYAGQSAEQQVNTLYQHLLGRDAEPGGRIYWAEKLDEGTSIAEVARFITDAAEGEDATAFETRLDNAQDQTYGEIIDTLYAGYYGRAADEEGKAFWLEAMKSADGDLEPIIEAFGNSDEYVEQYGSMNTESQLDALYNKLFSRDPDPEGAAYWAGQIDSGALTLSSLAFTLAQAAAADDKEALDNNIQAANSSEPTPESESKISFPGEYSVEYGIQSIPSASGIKGGAFLNANFDLDGNGYTDFLLADGVFPPNPLRPTTGDIIYQSKDGFMLSSDAFSGTVHPREFAFGDFNQDNITDFFIAAHGYDAPPFPGEKNVLAVSSEEGYINTQPNLTSPDGFTHSAATGDINGNGYIDILSVNLGESPQLYLNDGSGQFSEASSFLSDELTEQGQNFSATSSLIHDIDGDGFADIIFGSQNTGNYGESKIYFGSESGKFTEAETTLLNDLSVNESNQTIVDIQAIDIDLDGNDDIVTSYTLTDPSYTGAGIQIFRNEGNREFTDISFESLSGQNFDIDDRWIVFLDVVDFNNDGVSDIYLDRAGGSSSSPLVLLGDGRGQFHPLMGDNIINNSDFDFLLSNTRPSYRNGQLELAGVQYFEDDYIINRINITEPAIVENLAINSEASAIDASSSSTVSEAGDIDASLIGLESGEPLSWAEF